MAQMKNGQWGSAYESVKIVLAHRPEDPFSLGLLKFAESKGLITSLNRKFIVLLAESGDKIISFWEKLHKTDTLNINILQVLTALYIDDNVEKGRLSANRIIEIDSANTHGYLFRGHIEMKTGNYEEATNHYQKAYRLDTTLLSAQTMLAHISLLHGKWESTIKHLSMIPYTDAKYSELHLYEILCHLKLGELAEAETLLHTAKKDVVRMNIALNVSHIENYIDKLRTNSLTKKDTFVILTNLATRLLGLLRPEQIHPKVSPMVWPIAVLTIHGIEFIFRADQFTEMKLIKLPRPHYPEELLRMGVEGSVEILALVDTNGSIMRAEVSSSSGYDGFDDEALKIVKMAKLEPARISGVPIRTWISFPINFRILR
jgi:TonB family protein